MAQTCMLLRPDGGNCVKIERLSDERAMGDAQNHRFRVTNSCAMTLQINYQLHGKKTLFVPGHKSETIFTAIGDEEPSGIQVQCNPGQARASQRQGGQQSVSRSASASGNREAACRDRGNSCGAPCMDLGREAGHACAVICDKAVETCERTGRLFSTMVGYNATAGMSGSRHSDDVDDDTSAPAPSQAGHSYQAAPMIQYRPIAPVGGHTGCARVVLGECR